MLLHYERESKQISRENLLTCTDASQTGADALYVMNYPGYVGVALDECQEDDAYQSAHPGLGFKYSSDKVLRAVVGEQEHT